MIKDLLKSRPVILGRIKLGDKGGDKGQPRKFDGFKIYQAGKDSAGQPIPDEGLQALYESKYGTPLRKIPIFFLYNTLAANFDCSYQYHKKFDGMDVLVCEGDGDSAQRVKAKKTETGYELVKDDKGGFIREAAKCPCERWNPDPDADAKKHPCKWAAKMAFMLADVPRGGGYYIFRTHSFHSIRNTYFALTQMESFTFGNMAGIPVNLVVEPQKNKRNMTIYVARIEWDFDPKAMRLKAIEEVKSVMHLKAEIATSEATAHRLLTADDPDEDVAGEFYPEEPPKDEPKKEIPQAGTVTDPVAQNQAQKTASDNKLAEMLTPPAAPGALPQSPVEAPAPEKAKRGRKPKVQAPAAPAAPAAQIEQAAQAPVQFTPPAKPAPTLADKINAERAAEKGQAPAAPTQQVAGGADDGKPLPDSKEGHDKGDDAHFQFF